jgi:hypothetical protein
VLNPGSTPVPTRNIGPCLCKKKKIKEERRSTNYAEGTLTEEGSKWVNVGPWLWKEAKKKEEKVKSELRRRHSDYHWVEVSKREEKME